MIRIRPPIPLLIVALQLLSLSTKSLAKDQIGFEQTDPVNDEIAKAVAKYTNVKPEIMFALFWKESHYDPSLDNPQTSACGLAQMVIKTARSVGLDDCHDATKSVWAATQYFSTLVQRFSRPGITSVDRLAVAGYHIGPGCVDLALRGQACQIIEKTASECALAKANSKTCVSIISRPCESHRWSDCIPPQTQEYVRSVYDNYRPLGQSMIDWQRKKAQVEEQNRVTTKISGQISDLESRPTQTPETNAAILIKQDELKEARLRLDQTKKEAGDAKDEATKRETELLLQLGNLKSNYRRALNSAGDTPDLYLYERDAHSLGSGYVRPANDVCAHWTIYSNAYRSFHYVGGAGTIVSSYLPTDLISSVEKIGHAGVVTLEFSVDDNLGATNVRLTNAITPEYESAARQILALHLFPPFTTEQLKVPDPYQLTGCRDLSARRSVTVVFGRQLDAGFSNVSDPHWEAVKNALGELKDVPALKVIWAFAQTGSSASGATNTVYVTRPDNGAVYPHICRNDASYYENTTLRTSIVLFKGPDEYSSTRGQIYKATNGPPDLDCAQLLMPNRLPISNAVSYVGNCKFPEILADEVHDCFVDLQLDGNFAIWFVNRTTNLPAMVQFGFPNRDLRVFSGYKKVGGIALPMTMKFLQSGPLNDGSAVEVRILEIDDSVLPYSLFQPDVMDPDGKAQ